MKRTKRTYFQKLLFSFAVMLSPLLLMAQSDEATEYKPVAVPAGFTSSLNVVYTRVEDWEGKMDIYLPPKGNHPTPVVINIHGGGWNHGVKESQTGFSSFFKEGFAVVNMEYRLAPAYTAPAAVEDARCALIYVVQHAKELNIDVDKIVVMGGSSGGHLALMAGLLGNDHRFDNNCPATQNIKVAAIIDKYGITDVWDWGHGVVKSKSVALWLGDKAKDEQFIKSVSPITYINKNSPPVFIVHGDADPTVPYQQSVELHKALLAANVKTEFITVPDGLHGKFPTDENRRVNKAIMQFINECIK